MTHNRDKQFWLRADKPYILHWLVHDSVIAFSLIIYNLEYISLVNATFCSWKKHVNQDIRGISSFFFKSRLWRNFRLMICMFCLSKPFRKIKKLSLQYYSIKKLNFKLFRMSWVFKISPSVLIKVYNTIVCYVLLYYNST